MQFRMRIEGASSPAPTGTSAHQLLSNIRRITRPAVPGLTALTRGTRVRTQSRRTSGGQGAFEIQNGALLNMHTPYCKVLQASSSSMRNNNNNNTADMSSRNTPIDTSRFMARYFHPQNIAAARGEPSVRVKISTNYSKSRGLYRQKQVDDEIDRIRYHKRPSKSKITITISNTNLLSLYHHHHCLDVQLTSRSGKGRVVWTWRDWETATDERVMKGAIAALDSCWKDTTEAARSTLIAAFSKQEVSGAGEKRKRAVAATEFTARHKKFIEVIDLVENG